MPLGEKVRIVISAKPGMECFGVLCRKREPKLKQFTSLPTLKEEFTNK